MIKLLRDDELLDLVQLSDVAHFNMRVPEIILSSLEYLSEEGCYEADVELRAFQKIVDEAASCQNKKLTKWKHYSLLVRLSSAVEQELKFCARRMCEDWDRFLTPVEEITKPDFACVVRAVRPYCYRNELRYPIVSASLFTKDHDILYDGRDVALILKLDPKMLIMTSVRDSGTAVLSGRFPGLEEMPLSTRTEAIVSTFSILDRFLSYKSYTAGLKKEDPGELLFDSRVEVEGVFFTSSATDKQKQFAKSYAIVYDLPLFKYEKDTKNFIKIDL